ncbi:hypothetical protein BCR36DRAFT_294074 [Piromyces finnis]|uniref:Uncharacterized protein n=1 Tax=Piromyces finnis TaxID=1754191 RepID=A0A1Y1V6U7_9FUNG|nr:hypothetical protein BCR36DRAFT_294074 [Piromyces finnis]|eukprot:ORX48182.1 hypothetical protein BCR36DRAFT_294074 [Piromyces finnis]
MIIKNLDSSLNVISELPQSCTSINDILNSPATVNLTRRNSKIKTIFIDHIKDKIQRRRSSISIPMIKNEKRKSDISNENERLKSDEYHGYEIFNSDDSHSMTKSEIVNKISKHNYEETNELYDDTLKRHFVENSDDSYNGSIHNQDSEFSPESTNMETINEESYDSLSASHQNLHKNNLEKISSKSKLNESTNLDEETHKCSDDNDNESLSSESSSISIDESTNSEEDDNKSAIEDENNKNDCVREQKTFNHKHLFEDSEVLLDNDNDNGSKMSHISSIEDTDSLIICNNNINDMKLMKSEYFDVIENDDERNDDESNCETIEIINYEKDENKHENEILNSNEIYYSINIPLNNEDIIQNNSKNNKKNKNEILKNYLTNEEIISKVSNTEKIELKRKKFSTVGPRSSIKIILDDEIESNLKDAMSTTNLNGENDPSEFLNKKLENNERNINVSEKSLSKIFKNDQNNVFESNMAFINQKFDSNIKDLNEDVKYYNSNYSIFYDKMENGKENMNNEFKEMENINESNEEFFDSNEDVKTDKNTNSNSEIVEKLFIPLKGGSESDETVDVNKIKNEMIEEKSDETNKHHNDVITTQHTEKELNNEMNEEERKYENVELSINKIDNSNHKRKPSKRNSKRVPRCISKSSAAVLSMLQFDLENVDVDKVNDNDLDNLISKTHKREESNLSDNCQDILNQKPTLMNLNTEFFSCEDNTFNNSGSNIKEKEPKLDVIDSQSNISLNKNNSSLQQTIPKSPAKPAPPPPSYNKIKTKSSSLVEVSITDIYENESENQIKTISEEIRERLEYKRKKNHLPDDINKMTYKEMLKEKKAIKQELVLLKSMYTNNHSNNSTSSQCNHNDFINNPLKNVVSSTLETNNSLNGKPPLNYDYNNNVISKKLQKDDIKFMKELYQKYAEIKFMIAKQVNKIHFLCFI